jgi:hypothetical protein
MRKAVVVCLAVLLLSGCTDNPSSPSAGQSTGSSGGGTPGPTLPPSGSGATSAPAPTGASSAQPGSTVTLRDADKGRTVTVKVGDPVELTLTGTDWGFTDPKPASVLTPMSPPIVAREPGNSSISFRAAKAGTATVLATKQTGDTFTITVVVQ